jgi:hypothetical protein
MELLDGNDLKRLADPGERMHSPRDAGIRRRP